MAESLDRRDAIVLLGMLLVGACGGAKSKGAATGPTTTTTPAATTVAPTSVAPTTISPTTSTPPTTVTRGHNAYLTQQVLQSDASGYNGTWSAQWNVPAANQSGTIAGTVRVDPVARTFVLTFVVHGPLLGGTAAVPPISVTVDADSFVYDDATGRFAITAPTAIGTAHLHDNGGFGKFVLEIPAITGRTDVKTFVANGVADRPDSIPITFRVGNADGSTRDGTITFRPGG